MPKDQYPMKLQFKVQQYQTDAVDAVVDCFAGQPKVDGISYRVDPGKVAPAPQGTLALALDSGLRNAEIALSPAQLLDNVHSVQRTRGLPLSKSPVDSKAAPELRPRAGTGRGAGSRHPTRCAPGG